MSNELTPPSCRVVPTAQASRSRLKLRRRPPARRAILPTPYRFVDRLQRWIDLNG